MKILLKILKSPLLYLFLIACGFFFLYSLPRMNKIIINSSPDENANYYFSKLLAEEGTMVKNEPLNFGIDPIVHPRSINVNQYDNLVPGSFLGMILIYGLIGKVLGSAVIIYLTPFFACFAALFFYGIIKKIFSWQVAFISSVLMLAHPAFWYYSTRSMFHNVLFVSFLVIGVYFLLSAFEKKIAEKWHKKISLMFSAAAGLFIGLALIIRTAEAPWVLLMLCILLVFYFKHVKLFNLLLIILMVILTGVPILYYNQILYNNSLLSGYANLAKLRENGNFLTKIAFSETSLARQSKALTISNSETPINSSMPVVKATFWEKMKKSIYSNIPSGLKIHLDLAVARTNFSLYFLRFFSWLSAAFIIGLTIFILFYLLNLLAHLKFNDPEHWLRRILGNPNLKAELVFFLIFVGVSFYLIIYYGSWIFHDTPNIKLITIGTSYTRYWLPIYLMSLVFIGVFIHKISRLLFFKFPRFIFVFLFCLLLIFYSVLFVYNAPHEGIGIMLKNAGDYANKKQRVVNFTEQNAIIINQYYDKFIFPERAVIASKMYDDPGVIKNLPILLKRAPIYYYSIGLKRDDIDFINRRYLKEYGIELIDGKMIAEDENIWRVSPAKSNEGIPLDNK